MILFVDSHKATSPIKVGDVVYHAPTDIHAPTVHKYIVRRLPGANDTTPPPWVWVPLAFRNRAGSKATSTRWRLTSTTTPWAPANSPPLTTTVSRGWSMEQKG